MSTRLYLTLAEFSEIRQNGCIPLVWLALFRNAEALDETPAEEAEDGSFWGYRTSVWEALESLDRTISILQRDRYLWAYFDVLAVFLEEVQQLPTEEEITLDCAEFAAVGPAQAAAARQAVDDWRAAMRLLQQDEPDAALAALRTLSGAVSLDRGLPFSGDLAQDGAALGGRSAAREELVWTLTGEIYEGPDERLEFFTPEALEAAYWSWLADLPDDPAPLAPGDVPRNGHGSA